VSVTLTYNPATLRVRTVQEGTFMRQGGATPTFSQRADPATGRVDVSIARSGDPTGASGSGLLAAVIFDAIAPGPAPFSVSGVATAPDGSSVPLAFTPAGATVK
jgi:general secretion pathway protein D